MNLICCDTWASLWVKGLNCFLSFYLHYESLSHVWLFEIPWTAAHHAPLSMGFSRQGWVAIPFSRGCSQPRDRTWVSCTAHRFFTVWASREVLLSSHILSYCLTHTHYALFTDEETVTVQGQKRIRPGYLFWAKQSVQSFAGIWFCLS